jgi:recombination protein RecT
VYANDEFDVDYGLADSLVHKPNLKGTRGEPFAYYAIAKFLGGGHAFIVMTQQDMIEHREKYAPRNKYKAIVGPWKDNFEGQALKTTIRQLFKYMPKSTEMALAVAADDGIRVDITPTVDAAEATEHPDFLEGEVVGEDQPDGQAEQAGPPSGNGRPALAKQKAEIAELAEKVGAGGEPMLPYLSDMLAREVTSLDTLTNREAAQVIARMNAYLKQQEPPAGDAQTGTAS